MVVGSDRFWHGHERLFHDNMALPTTFTYGEGRYLVAKLCARNVFHVVDHDDRHDDPERDPHDPALWPCLSPRAAPGQTASWLRTDICLCARLSFVVGRIQWGRYRAAMGSGADCPRTPDDDVEHQSHLLERPSARRCP